MRVRLPFQSILVRRQSQMLRTAIVTGVLLLLPALGFVAARPRLAPLALVVALVPLVAFAMLRESRLGFAAMLLATVFVRFRLPTGTASEIVISLIACGGMLVVWIVRMLVEEKRLFLQPTPANFPLLAFMATVFISLLWSRAYQDVFVHNIGSPFVSVASAVVMALLPAAFLMTVNLLRDVHWLRGLAWLYLSAGAVSLLVTLVLDLGVGPTQTIRRIVFQNGLLWINTHGLYATWYVALALAFVLFDRRLHWAMKTALLAYIAGWIYVGFFRRMAWLSGWVPIFVVIGVLTFLRFKWLALVLIVVMVIGAGGYYWRTEFQLESERSGITRLAAYEVNWRVTGKHLLLGTGPAGYASYYMSYFPTEGMASHSNYIDVAAQTGIVGTVFFIWFFVTQMWGSYTIRRALKGRGDFAEGLAAAVLAGTTGCVVAMALGDWLLPFAYTQGIVGFDSAVVNWFFMGTVWALQFSLQSSSPDRFETL